VTYKGQRATTYKGESSACADDRVTDFDAFWSAYPRKVGKQAARRAWDRAKGRPAIPAILAAIEAQRATEQWRRDGGQYIPHPATWISHGRWDDEVQAPARNDDSPEDPNEAF